MLIRQQRRRELRAWILSHRRTSLADAFSAWVARPCRVAAPLNTVASARGLLLYMWVRASTSRIRRLLCADKEQFFIDLAQQAQVAAENNDQRTLYACVRRLRKQKPAPLAVLRSDEGEIIASQEDLITAQRALACKRHA